MQQGRLVMDLLSHAGNEVMADIRIVTKDGGILQASRFVLGARSSVLQNILYSDGQARDSREIRLGYSTAVVRNLIHYCRSNEISPCHTKDETYSRAMVELCDCGRTYRLFGLEDMVCECIQSILNESPHLACAVFDEAFSKEAMETIKQMALSVIRADPETSLLKQNVFQSNRDPGVAFLSSDSICEILGDGRMCTEEIVMFQSLILWAECNPTVSSISGAKVRERRALAKGFAERYIDLSCIAPSDLLGCVTNSGLVGFDKVSDGMHELALRLEYEGANVSKRRATVHDVSSGGVESAPPFSNGGGTSRNFDLRNVDDDGDDVSVLATWVTSPQREKPYRPSRTHERRLMHNGARVVSPQAKQKSDIFEFTPSQPKKKIMLADVVDYFVGDGCCSHPRYKDPTAL